MSNKNQWWSQKSEVTNLIGTYEAIKKMHKYFGVNGK